MELFSNLGTCSQGMLMIRGIYLTRDILNIAGKCVIFIIIFLSGNKLLCNKGCFSLQVLNYFSKVKSKICVHINMHFYVTCLLNIFVCIFSFL